MSEHEYALRGATLSSTENSTPNIRKIAEGRQHALGTRDPVIAAASPAVFWAAFREGANWALTSSAKMSSLFQDVAEQILLMSEARNAAPLLCPHCNRVLEP